MVESCLIQDVKINSRLRSVNQIKVKEISESIKQIGLLNPITINQDNSLIAGLHRLEAHKFLGIGEIKVNRVNLFGDSLELAEIDENLIRNDLTELEKGQHLIRRKEIYEKLFPETKKGAINQHTKVLTAESAVSTFTKDTAIKTGISERALQVSVQIAKNITPEVQKQIQNTPMADQKTILLELSKQTPEKQKSIVEKINTGESKNIKQAVQQINRENKIIIPLPKNKYDLIYADPPWRYEFSETVNREIENNYPTMDLEEIKLINVPSADNAILFLWATAPKLEECLDVMKSWGFKYRTCAVWDKEIIGMGYWFRGQHELLLVGVKGKFSTPDNNKKVSSVYSEQRTKHSKKPDFYYSLLEEMFPDSTKIELFARKKHNDNWSVWGNEKEVINE